MIIGIDLGTTNSVISALIDNQAVAIKIMNHSTVPSIVDYSQNECKVGNEALDMFANGSENTIFSIKRNIHLNNKFCGKTPIEISADILKFLKKETENTLQHQICDVVITVPAQFNEFQRIATKKAASLAGLKVLRLLNEPTAAALAYGINHDVSGVYAVYDFGGGTFDFSILRLTDGIFQVIASGGDNYLGGDDVDKDIVKYNLDSLGLKEEDLSRFDVIKCRKVAKYLKENIETEHEKSVFLSPDKNNRVCNENINHNNKDTQVHIQQTIPTQNPGIQNSVVKQNTQSSTNSINTNKNATQTTQCEYKFKLNSEILKSILDKYLQKTFNIINATIKDANIENYELSGVLLVGGMTKAKYIHDNVEAFFQCELINNINPDEVVAIGACVQSQLIQQNKNGALLIDVTPLSIGVETIGGDVDYIIPRNTPIPVSFKREYTTYIDNQSSISFNIVQGERKIAKHCKSLINFQLKDIPPMPAGKVRVTVTFSIDINGLLEVSAVEKNTGIEQKIVLSPHDDLNIDDIYQLLSDGIQTQKDDEIFSRYLKLKIDIERNIENWNKLLPLFSLKKRVFLSEKIKSLSELLENYKLETNIDEKNHNFNNFESFSLFEKQATNTLKDAEIYLENELNEIASINLVGKQANLNTEK